MSLDNRKVKQTILNQSTDFLIGELLLKAGVIKQNQLDEALKLAGNKHMQLGQMLIMARHITPRDLQAAIDAQSALRDRVMEMNDALRALSFAHRQGISFNEAHQKQSQEQAAIDISTTNRLGELLTTANLISTEQLAHAMQRSMATGLPLGRMLVLNGVINETMLSSALEIQIRIRDGTLTRAEALSCLQEMGGAKVVDQSGVARLHGSAPGQDKIKQPRKRGIRLGELLVLAGILSEMDVMNALEFSLVKELQLGQVLIDHGYITQELCEAALKLQSLIDSGNLDCEQAAQSLKSVHSGNLSLLQAMEKFTSATNEGTYIDLQNLLTESQLLSKEEIQAAMELAVSNPRLMTRILAMTGYLDETRSEVILTCYDALIKSKLSWQDAINMLTYCQQCLKEGPVPVDELLKRLNLTKPVDHDTKSLVQNISPVETPVPPVSQTAPAESKRHTGKTTAGMPALNQLQVESNLLQPTGGTTKEFTREPAAAQPVSQSGKETHTGKTTTNMPALNPPMIGTDLLQPNMTPSTTAQSAPTKLPATRQSISLKGLLTSQELPAIKNMPDQDLPGKPAPPDAPAATSSANTQKLPDTRTDNNKEGLMLSEQEKKLIQAASSLTASPEDIMAAMHLAIKKEKSIESPPDDKT